MICRFSSEAERRELTPVDNLFISEYLPEAEGQDVQVYLYGLMQCYYPSMRDTSIDSALSIPQSRVLRAFVYWQSKGLVRILSEEPLTVEYINATIEEATIADNNKYSKLVASLNALTAPKQFLLRELKYVYNFIEQYGMEEGAVLELVAYCIQLKGKRVSINYIDTVAQDWCEKGILTTERAQQYISDYLQKKHGASEVLKRWNKRRKPTQDEMDLYDKWISQWGFDEEAILAVCPQLVSVGTPTFAILNDRLNTLYLQNKTKKEKIVESEKGFSSDREFALLLFSRLGKIEPPTQTHIAQIGMFLHEKKMPEAVILLAADACTNADRPFGYLKTILKDWCEKGILTVPQAEQALVEHENKKKTSRPAKKDTFVFEQRAVNNEEVAARFVNLDEDI